MNDYYMVKKTVDFAAAHSIDGAGKCANKHGHNWEATIGVHFWGELDKRGFVADVRDIKDAAYKYDHDDLDKYFDYASTENVAKAIAEDVLMICLAGEARGQFDIVVNLVETKNNSAIAQAHGNNEKSLEEEEAELDDITE